MSARDERGPVGQALSEGGAIVGACAALGGAAGFVLGAIAHEIDETQDPHEWARSGGTGGGVLGLLIWARNA